MIDQLVFKDVWQANNAKSEWDAIAAWRSAGDKLGVLTDQQRAKLLSIIGYDGDRVCGTLTCQIGYLPLVRENMAFIQAFDINGERTKIVVKGRVRSADISASNVILSTNLADAAIDYNGAGLVSDSSKAGLVTRVLNWIGLP